MLYWHDFAAYWKNSVICMAGKFWAVAPKIWTGRLFPKNFLENFLVRHPWSWVSRRALRGQGTRFWAQICDGGPGIEDGTFCLFSDGQFVLVVFGLGPEILEKVVFMWRLKERIGVIWGVGTKSGFPLLHWAPVKGKKALTLTTPHGEVPPHRQQSWPRFDLTLEASKIIRGPC